MTIFTCCYSVTLFQIDKEQDQADKKALLKLTVNTLTDISIEIRSDCGTLDFQLSHFVKKSAFNQCSSPPPNGDSKESSSLLNYNRLNSNSLIFIKNSNSDVALIESVIKIKFQQSTFLDQVLSYLDRVSSFYKSTNEKPTSKSNNTISTESAEDEFERLKSKSCFDRRTESASAKQYFQFYALLSQQQNMMQDYVRTSTYQRAIHLNSVDFKDKVVLDVGAGSGILSYFAIQAGARKVYAVEASNVSEFCQRMVSANNLAGRIIVVNGKIEDIKLPEPVDVIISEPMGYMLFNERMLETYIHSRKFLRNHSEASDSNKMSLSNSRSDLSVPVDTDEIQNASLPNSNLPQMFPSTATLYAAPFTDEALFLETQGKASFWTQQYFHGVNLTSLHENSLNEYFSQPIVDTFDIEICVARPNSHIVDFRTSHEQELQDIDMPLVFNIRYSGLIHGLAFWFDVAFIGSQKTVWLSTAPTEQLTHWYQVRCLFQTPLYAQEGDVLHGRCHLVSNQRQSYDVYVELSIPGTDTIVHNTLDLKNPCFRYVGYPATNQNSTQADPRAPTDQYFDRQTQNQICNGYTVPTIYNPEFSQPQNYTIEMNGNGEQAAANPGCSNRQPISNFVISNPCEKSSSRAPKFFQSQMRSAFVQPNRPDIIYSDNYNHEY